MNTITIDSVIASSDADIDFLTHYKLVDPGLIESYARAFVVEDNDFDTVISAKVNIGRTNNRIYDSFKTIY